MKRLFAPIEDGLERVEARLQEELRSDHSSVDALTRYGWSMGGKRLRPALLLLTARATGELQSDHITLATVVEMIHMATLVHDDVLDGATVRRHMETINCRWSNQASILLGDYLFSHAFYLASTLDSTYACRLIGRSTNRVCEGEIRQNESCGQLDLNESDYLSIIDAKTAELCACACRLGAHYAGADGDTTERLAEYGRLIGMAFQITDDILDLIGSESQTGKSLGTDAAQQKPTLPLIYGWQRGDHVFRSELERLLSASADEGPSRLVAHLRSGGAIDRAFEYAERLTREARAIAAELPSSSPQAVLMELAEQVVRRSC